MNFVSYSFSEESTALIVGGGFSDDESKTKIAEIIPKSKVCKNTALSSLPTDISWSPSLVQTSDEKILLCGGSNNEQRCLEFTDNQWNKHSDLTGYREYSSAVSMPEGIFIFGGHPWSWSHSPWEWLPSGTNQWQSGDTIIESGFSTGCAVEINETDILLIGGYTSRYRVLKFDTITKNFTNLGDVLKEGRSGHACTRFEDQVIVTGGRKGSPYFTESRSTEIINLNDLTKAHTAGNLNLARAAHGLVVVHVENKSTVLALGGGFSGPNGGLNSLNSIEIWNATSKTWRMTSMKLSKPRIYFGILSVPTRLLCP